MNHYYDNIISSHPNTLLTIILYYCTNLTIYSIPVGRIRRVSVVGVL